MQQLPPHVLIAMQTIKPTVEKIDGVEEQLRKAFAMALDHWLLYGGEEQNVIKAGVGSVMMCYKPESVEYQRMENEVQGLATLNAMLTACQAGMSVEPPDNLVGMELPPYCMLKIYNEVKDEENARTD